MIVGPIYCGKKLSQHTQAHGSYEQVVLRWALYFALLSRSFLGSPSIQPCFACRQYAQDRQRGFQVSLSPNWYPSLRHAII